MHRPQRRTVRAEAGPSVQVALPATAIRQRSQVFLTARGHPVPLEPQLTHGSSPTTKAAPAAPGFAAPAPFHPNFAKTTLVMLCGRENANRRFEAKQSDHIYVGLEIKN